MAKDYTPIQILGVNALGGVLIYSHGKVQTVPPSWLEGKSTYMYKEYGPPYPVSGGSGTVRELGGAGPQAQPQKLITSDITTTEDIKKAVIKAETEAYRQPITQPKKVSRYYDPSTGMMTTEVFNPKTKTIEKKSSFYGYPSGTPTSMTTATSKMPVNSSMMGGPSIIEGVFEPSTKGSLLQRKLEEVPKGFAYGFAMAGPSLISLPFQAIGLAKETITQGPGILEARGKQAVSEFGISLATRPEFTLSSIAGSMFFGKALTEGIKAMREPSKVLSEGAFKIKLGEPEGELTRGTGKGLISTPSKGLASQVDFKVAMKDIGEKTAFIEEGELISKKPMKWWSGQTGSLVSKTTKTDIGSLGVSEPLIPKEFSLSKSIGLQAGEKAVDLSAGMEISEQVFKSPSIDIYKSLGVSQKFGSKDIGLLSSMTKILKPSVESKGITGTGFTILKSGLEQSTKSLADLTGKISEIHTGLIKPSSFNIPLIAPLTGLTKQKQETKALNINIGLPKTQQKTTSVSMTSMLGTGQTSITKQLQKILKPSTNIQTIIGPSKQTFGIGTLSKIGMKMGSAQAFKPLELELTRTLTKTTPFKQTRPHTPNISTPFFPLIPFGPSRYPGVGRPKNVFGGYTRKLSYTPSLVGIALGLKTTKILPSYRLGGIRPMLVSRPRRNVKLSSIIEKRKKGKRRRRWW